MSRQLTLLLALVVFAAGCATRQPPPASAVFSHAPYDRALRRIVDAEGRVDYAALQRDSSELERYVAQLAQVSPDSHPQLFAHEDARLAYWINAYNATAISIVLRHHPIESVRDVRRPWWGIFLPKLAGFFVFERASFGGDATSLYVLEHLVIRRRFADPRIHFALNCASNGCPRLPPEAFDPERLDQQLGRETRRFVNEERNVSVDLEAQQIVLSSIFEWYEADFLAWQRSQGDEPSLLAYISPWLAPERAAQLDLCTDCEVRFRPYDWGLNGQRLGE